MKNALRIFVHFCFSLSLLSCISSQNNTEMRPVIIVNNYKLSLKDFSFELARKIKKFDALSAKDPYQIKIAKETIISSFISEILIQSYCIDHSIHIADEELEKEIAEFRSSYPDDPSFLKALTEENLSLDQWKSKMRTTLLQKKFFQILRKDSPPPTEKEIQNFYAENKDRYKRKESILLRQIVLDDYSKAQSIKDALSKKPFEKLASEYSVSPEKKNGGLVGWVEKGNVDVFDKAFQLPLKGVSPILESNYGFHIFKVESKRAASQIPLSEVRKSIEQELLTKIEQNAFTQWFQKQLKTAKILRDQDLINSVNIETKGFPK